MLLTEDDTQPLTPPDKKRDLRESIEEPLFKEIKGETGSNEEDEEDEEEGHVNIDDKIRDEVYDVNVVSPNYELFTLRKCSVLNYFEMMELVEHRNKK